MTIIMMLAIIMVVAIIIMVVAIIIANPDERVGQPGPRHLWEK